MNHFHEPRQFQPFPVTTNAVATPSDDVTTDAPTHRDMSDEPATDDVTHVAPSREVSPDVATESQDTSRQIDDMPQQIDRENYTLTIEDVAVRLADENVFHNPRTIQRWCQSGKLDCLRDEENGKRYLIEPTSLERIIATLLRDRDRQAQAMSRHYPDTPRSLPRQQETAPDNDARPAATERDMSRPMSDNRRDADATVSPAQADDVTSQARIQQLETELAMAKADKQVREQMVDYLKEKFEEMVDGTLDRAEQIGELRAENAQLKNLLNAAPSPQVDNVTTYRPEGRVE